GACQGFPELFYHDETERKGLRRAKEHAAKQVCESCPVLVQCRDYSLSVSESYGVWGGMTEMERHRILGRQRTGWPVSTTRPGGFAHGANCPGVRALACSTHGIRRTAIPDRCSGGRVPMLCHAIAGVPMRMTTTSRPATSAAAIALVAALVVGCASEDGADPAGVSDTEAAPAERSETSSSSSPTSVVAQ